MKITLCLLCLFFLCPQSARAERQLLDRVVAVVNDEAITQSELDYLLRPIYEQLKQEAEGPALFEKLTEIRLKLLNQLIEDKLVYQVAKDQKIEADEAEVEEQWQEFKSRFPNEDALEKALRDEGLTVKAVRERFRRQTMIRMLQDMEIRSKVVVSPLEVESFYREHPENFVEKDQLKIRSITIKKSDVAREKGLKDEEAWRVIQDLRQKVVGGEDFAALAKEYSEDVHASNGGLGDWIDRGQMVPAIDEVIFKMKRGEVSEIMETAMGYHLFKIEEKKQGRKASFEEAKAQIFSYLFGKKSNERFREWMGELKGKAYVSIR